MANSGHFQKRIKIGLYSTLILAISFVYQNCSQSELALPDTAELTQSIKEQQEAEEVRRNSIIEIISQPTPDSAALFGGKIDLSIEAQAGVSLNYQWKKDGVDIDGATRETLSVDIVDAQSSGDFTVLVSNDLESVESDVATITAVDPVLPMVAVKTLTTTPEQIAVNLSGAINIGQTTGLALATGGTGFTVGGQAVTSCAHYRFSEMTTARIRFDYRATKNAIGGDSCGPNNLTFCDTNPGIKIFNGTDGLNWVQRGGGGFGQVSNPNFEAFEIIPQQPYQHVLICRGSGGAGRDNIEFGNLHGFLTEL